MLRVSITSLGLLFFAATLQAQTTTISNTRTIGSGTQLNPIVTPVSKPTPRATQDPSPTPSPNPMPITSALANGGDSGCSTGCSSTNGCGTACGDCCLDRTLRVFGGWNLVENMDVALGTAGIPAELDFNPGWAIGGAMGKYMTSNLRRELEFTFRHNTPEQVVQGGDFDDDIDGFMRAYSVMGNLVYEAPNLRLGQFQPYFGTGIGVGIVDANMNYGGNNYTIDDAVVAYQGFAGVQREIGSRAKLFAEYRMFRTDRVDVVGPVGSTRDNYIAHNIFFGLQIAR